MLNIAVKAARKAGSVITRASEDIEGLTINKKSYNDFVSEVDITSEKIIIDTLKEAYPSHSFLGEESGLTEDSDNTWIIDPLDGTTNFLHNFPQYAISIALMQRGEITQGVVYDPNRNDLFTASKGQGAFLNDRRIRVSKKNKMRDALIGTGFPFRDFKYLSDYLKILEDIIINTSGVRRPGAAALDLAYVAAGLLVREAGGIVSDFSEQQDWLESGNIICSNPDIYEPFIKLVQKKLPKELKS